MTHPTLDQIHKLGLTGMGKAFNDLVAQPEATVLNHAEWLGLLLDRELAYRSDKKMEAKLRRAKLRHQASPEDVDYRAQRGLDRSFFQKLAQCTWIDAHEGIIITGPTGVGKSWLACALAHQACRAGHSALYQRVPKLFGELEQARADGRYPRVMRTLGSVKLLVLDDWGLKPLTDKHRHDLLELLEDRYNRGATIVTSQLPVDKWHEIIGGPTYADAVLDRLVHRAHRLDLSGESLRKVKASKKAGTGPTA